MNTPIVLSVWLVIAILLMPGAAQARYLNVNSGRFQTMDTFQGNNEDPLSLHKYLYAQDNPVNRKDPTGNFTELEIEVAAPAAAGIDTTAATASAVARAFAMRRLETAVARWTISTLVQLTAVGATIGGYEIYDSCEVNREFEKIKTQTAQRANPTESPHAYQNMECDNFAADAIRFFKDEGEEPEIIRFEAYPSMIKLDEIWANVGFFTGMPISAAGYHEGCLVDGEVFDNNLPFGVARRIWEKYAYSVDPIGKPVGSFISFRTAYKQGYGVITPAPSDF